ncbi:MAG TPA: cation diffusion facilitator family transporter [Ktedonobacterales bacterium]
MSIAHPHNHSHGLAGAALRTAFLVTIFILAVELIGGIVSHSLALLADAGHVLTDVVALGLAWFAAVQAQRPPNERKTFGYHRIGILAALANAATLVLVVAGIAFEAVRRLAHPEPVTPWIMFVAAGVGIAANLAIASGLRHGSENLNVRAALLHVLGDVGASAAVVAGGVVIALTGWYPADPLLSLVITGIVAWSAWGVLRETLDILMEAAPRTVNMVTLANDITRSPGVSEVHDLHVWAIAGGVYALSAHVQVADRPLSSCDILVADLKHMLADRYHIAHTTLQLECDDCGNNGLYCAMPAEPHFHTHE